MRSTLRNHRARSTRPGEAFEPRPLPPSAVRFDQPANRRPKHHLASPHRRGFLVATQRTYSTAHHRTSFGTAGTPCDAPGWAVRVVTWVASSNAPQGASALEVAHVPEHALDSATQLGIVSGRWAPRADNPVQLDVVRFLSAEQLACSLIGDAAGRSVPGQYDQPRGEQHDNRQDGPRLDGVPFHRLPLTGQAPRSCRVRIMVSSLQD